MHVVTSPIAKLRANNSNLDKTLTFLNCTIPNVGNNNSLHYALVLERLRSVLTFCLLEKQTVSYSYIASAVFFSKNDYGHRDHKFYELLGDLSTQCVQNGFGMLSALVVREKLNLPGNEFFQLYERLRNVTLPRNANGMYIVADLRKAWDSELKLLGC